jgi:hypothetical protein
LNEIADPSESDFMVVARPTEPMSLTYRILYSPEEEIWTLTQSVRVWVPSRSSWAFDELVEIRYWSLDKLLATLRTFIDGADGYFEVEGAASLQAAVDRVTNR